MKDMVDQLTEMRNPDFERVLTNPYLDIAARLWEPERYAAFRVCYTSMRRLDDLVDYHRVSDQYGDERVASAIDEELHAYLRRMETGEVADTSVTELIATMSRFAVPIWPWTRLVRAMRYDLTHSTFPRFIDFLRYCEGAAVAPAAVFVHLCGTTFDGSGYSGPEFDIRRAARPLALFSYLTHIIRDFRKDQQAGLNYFCDSLVRASGLTSADLRHAAERGATPPELRSLLDRYVELARFYRDRARSSVDRLKPVLEPRYGASLELIHRLYSAQMEFIERHPEAVAAGQVNLPESQVRRTVMTLRY